MGLTVSKFNNRSEGWRMAMIAGELIKVGTPTVRVIEMNKDGMVTRAEGATVPTDGDAGYAKGCKFIDTDATVGSVELTNEGSETSADFNVVETAASVVTSVTAGAGMTGGGTEGAVTLNVIADETTIAVTANQIAVKAGGIGTTQLADASVTAKKVVETQACTATADGLTTGAITALTGFKKFVTVTSGAATDAITLPGITSDTIGQEIFITVGANGYELLTVASSNVTINQVDSDGTNQLDVAANTTVRCTQISASAWLAETIAATTIVVTAPDND